VDSTRNPGGTTTINAPLGTCAQCRETRALPYRRDDLGGYVCLTCVEEALDRARQDRAVATQRLNEPAGQLPVTGPVEADAVEQQRAYMALRDSFARAALCGDLASGRGSGMCDRASLYYRFADAMMEARTK